jgi:hypothetical protein
MQGASVFAMGLVMLWRQDPTASPAFFVALTPIVIAIAWSRIPRRPMPAGCQRSPSTGRSKKLGWENPATPAQQRRCVDVIGRYVGT